MDIYDIRNFVKLISKEIMEGNCIRKLDNRIYLNISNDICLYDFPNYNKLYYGDIDIPLLCTEKEMLKNAVAFWKEKLSDVKVVACIKKIEDIFKLKEVCA